MRAEAVVKYPEISNSKTRIISIANQKGGVGKTTTAMNLGTALAAIKKKVLLLDLDPQGNASTGLGIKASMRKISSYDLILNERDLSEAALKSDIEGLDVVPSDMNLSGAEIELISEKNREYKLDKVFKRSSVSYDYIIIDCPPSLNLLTLNALTASQSVIVPLQCEFFALEGLSFLMKTIERVKNRFNSKLNLDGVVLTMFDGRNNLSSLVAEDVKEVFGAKVYDTIIPRNVKVSEAPSHGKPVLIYDLKCKGSVAYIDLAKEFIRREEKIRIVQ